VPPRLVSRAEWSVTSLAGNEVTLPCEVTGDPWPVISWSRDQLEIEFYSEEHKYMMMDSGSLIIPDVDVQDAGRYLCVAENPAGVVSQDITLIVHGTTTLTVRLSVCLSRFIVHSTSAAGVVSQDINSSCVSPSWGLTTLTRGHPTWSDVCGIIGFYEYDFLLVICCTRGRILHRF